MEPAIGTGDVVVAQQIPPTDSRVGDIVTFRDPLDHARLITHRVREIHVRGDLVTFVTKGDANSSLERWAVPRTGTIGRVSFHVPRIGYMMVWIRSTLGILMLIVLPTLLLGASELWRLWRPRGAHEPGTPERRLRQEREPAEEPGRARDRWKRGSRGRRFADEVVA
jgi:signal peptidase